MTCTKALIFPVLCFADDTSFHRLRQVEVGKFHFSATYENKGSGRKIFKISQLDKLPQLEPGHQLEITFAVPGSGLANFVRGARVAIWSADLRLCPVDRIL
eukprot:180525-Chlamydomonas_euryale.AAC.4